MGVTRSILLVLCALAVAASARSEDAAPGPEARLMAEVAQGSQAMRNLEQLCDGFGPRMTGSPQLRAAQAWAMHKLRGYGAVNVHEEGYALGRPWQRGAARARLLNAGGHSLSILQKAWTTGTAGPVQGEVALLDVRTLAQFRAAAPAMAGKIMLVVSGPKASEAEKKDVAGFVAEVNRVTRAAGIVAVLLVSDKADGLQEMWGGPGSRFDGNTGILTSEGAGLLRRLLARGIVPRLEVQLGGGFGKAPVQAYNVVAEIRGSELPDEVVILGAHQDAWDLASGATDNGTGAVVALEVLRAMQALGLKPRRTLRVVLFSGEEQGLLGSKAYVARHRASLQQIQAVLVQDAGGGRILGFPDMKVQAWYDALTAALQPAAALGPFDVPYAVSRGSDHDSFFEHGIPAFSPIQDMLDYRTHTQHTVLDTVEHVKPADLIQGAQVMAVLAWALLNGPKLPQQ